VLLSVATSVSDALPLTVASSTSVVCFIQQFSEKSRLYNTLSKMGEAESPTPVPGLEIGEKAVVELSPTKSQAGLRASFTLEQEKAFDEFQALCRKSGIFEDPLGLENWDCRDGIDDEATLL